MVTTLAGYARVTEYGAPSAILPEYLADRLGWTLDAREVPKAVFSAGNGYAKLSTGERTLVVFALGIFNGWTPRRSKLPLTALLFLDGHNLSVVSDVLAAIGRGQSVSAWAVEWLPKRQAIEAAKKAEFERILRQRPLFAVGGVR
jgi:hypothetical protein